MSYPSATGSHLEENAAASLVNTFRLAAVTERLRKLIQTGPNNDSKEFHHCCISIAKWLDYSLANNEIPTEVGTLPLLFKQACRHGTTLSHKPALMVLMISVKHACQLGWFPESDAQELITLSDELSSIFGSFGSSRPGVNSPGVVFTQMMERFYPFVKLEHVIVSLEVKAGYKMMSHDFIVSKNMPHSSQERIMLFVAQTDNIDSSACIINPQEVSFLINGKGVGKRVNINMDSGPQPPTNITAQLKYGTNLLQVMGNSDVPYIIVIAFTGVILPPGNPLLKDYVQSEVTEGPSRVSLICPISHKRIKLPVKGHLCKHHQCFNYWNYILINLKQPSWRCPHCNQSVCYPDIRLDQNMVKILKEAGSNAADVVIETDGTWKVTKKTDETKEPVSHDLEDSLTFLNSGPVVHDLTGDDDDDDDDITEIDLFGDDNNVVDRKPCSSDAQDVSVEDYTSVFGISDMITVDTVTPISQTPSPRDGTGTTTTSTVFAIPNPSPQFSQVVTPTGPRWNQTSRRRTVPVTSQPNSYVTQMQRTSGPTVQSVTRTSDLMNVDLATTPSTINLPRMRGSIVPGSNSAIDHLIIRPTNQQSQTSTGLQGSQPVQTSQAQVVRPPWRT